MHMYYVCVIRMHTYKCTCIYVCSSQSNIDRGSTGEVLSLNSITRHLYTLIGGYDLAILTTRAQTSFMFPQLCSSKSSWY